MLCRSSRMWALMTAGKRQETLSCSSYGSLNYRSERSDMLTKKTCIKQADLSQAPKTTKLNHKNRLRKYTRNDQRSPLQDCPKGPQPTPSGAGEITRLLVKTAALSVVSIGQVDVPSLRVSPERISSLHIHAVIAIASQSATLPTISSLSSSGRLTQYSTSPTPP